MIRRLVCILLLLAVPVLLRAAPAQAEWWTTRTAVVGVTMIEHQFEGTDLCATVYAAVSEQDGAGTAFIYWRLCESGETLTIRQVPLAPGDLVINSTLKTATLKLPGTLLKWTVNGDGRRSDYDTATHVGGVVTRSLIRDVENWGTVSGTLENRASTVDQPHTLHPRGAHIWREITLGASE